MFTGIVETKSKIQKVLAGPQSFQITLEKPSYFNDLKRGDSIAVNGVCLTLENFDQNSIEFTVAAETLHVTGWSEQKLKEMNLVNLERSMHVSDRIHGHFVLGHVDGIGKIIKKEKAGDSLVLEIELPPNYEAYVWNKGSITLNGVSLTINKVNGSKVEVCLIPETLRSTNLSHLNIGDGLTFEVDSMARAFVHLWKLEKENASV
ncbi:MAG: riboflavin synthase [Bdellovibrionales bacterium]|nr:riboflavin synthase [Bdellovibrionales bacterium]